MSKIAFSEIIQTKPLRRVLLYATSILVFLIANCISLEWMGTSMVGDLLGQFVSVAGLPILGFVVTLLIRAYRIRKVRERYGDGSAIRKHRFISAVWQCDG